MTEQLSLTQTQNKIKQNDSNSNDQAVTERWLRWSLPAKGGHAGDAGSVPGLGRSPGGRRGNPLQYSFLENTKNRGAWRATVHGVTKSQTQLKRLSTHACIHIDVVVVVQSPTYMFPVPHIHVKH